MRLLITIPKSGTHAFWRMTGSEQLKLMLKGTSGPDEQFMPPAEVVNILSVLRDGTYCAHLPYHKEYEKWVCGYKQVLLLLRDPRDIIVSQAHYVENRPGSAMNYVIKPGLRLSDMKFKKRVDFLIERMSPVFRAFDTWLMFGFHVFFYEEFIHRPDETFERLHVLGYGSVDDIRKRSMIRDSTFRKGSTGDWKMDFTEPQKRMAEHNFGEIIARWGGE